MNKKSNMTLSIFRGSISKLQMKTVSIPPWLLARGAAGIARDQSQAGWGAMLAAVVGETGAALSAQSGADATIPVTAIDFEMNGKIFFGMLSGSSVDGTGFPLNESDQFAVIAEASEGGTVHEIKAIARPSDRLIALQPHCGRGRKAYAHRAINRIIIITVASACVAGWFAATRPAALFAGPSVFVLSLASGIAAFLAFFEYRIYIENYRPCVHLTEQILSTLGLADVQSIDLIKNSKRTRTANELPGYRWEFFRY